MAVQRHQELTGTAVAVQLGNLSGPLSQAVKLSAYRIVQEGLTNAFRHAGGAGQTIRAKQEDGGIVIEVQDAGDGIDLNTGLQSARLGLKGLTDRVESLGGRLDITSNAGRGTLLTAHLPWHPGAGDDD